jgi:hypothetical protein
MTNTFSTLFTYETLTATAPNMIVYKTIRMLTTKFSPMMEFDSVVINLLDGKIGFFIKEGDTIPEFATKLSTL